MKDTGVWNVIQPRAYGGLRTFDFQCRAVCEGGSEISNPAGGAHPAGLAVDFAYKGPNAQGGYNVGLDAKTHTQVTDGAAYAAWVSFGSLIHSEFPELTWGGDWKGRYRKLGYSDGKILLGFDPYHVELKSYRSHLPDKGTWKCVNGKAVQVTGAAEKAELTVKRHPVRSTAAVGLIAVAGVYAAWRLARRKR
jgi:hypothetical protein